MIPGKQTETASIVFLVVTTVTPWGDNIGWRITKGGEGVKQLRGGSRGRRGIGVLQFTRRNKGT